MKVSGSKGLHLSVPLNTEVTYEMTQPFAKAIAELAEQQLPRSSGLRDGEDAAARQGADRLEPELRLQDDGLRVCDAGEGRRTFHLDAGDLGGTGEGGEARKTQTRFSSRPTAAVKRIKRLGDLVCAGAEAATEIAGRLYRRRSPPGRRRSFPRGRAIAASPARITTRACANTRPSAITRRTPEPAAKPVAKGDGGKASIASSFRNTRPVICTTTGGWRCRACCARGPCRKVRRLSRSEARLAMHVEDHPLEYASFEGTIPPGNYGAGTVMVWDHGEYEDLTGNPAAAFHAGKMHVILRGKKLKGEWILVKDRREEDSNKWLLIKAGEAA